MGKTAAGGRREWSLQMYCVDEWQSVAFLLLKAAAGLFVFSLIFLFYFSRISTYLESNLAAGFIAGSTGLTSFWLFFAAGSLFYSSGTLRWQMSQRMIGAVTDWSAVRTALDVGCGHGILLNAVAKQLKKEGSSGRVVGLDLHKSATLSTLRSAAIQGVQEYVTYREGDMRRQLPFSDNYFDVVLSAVFVHRVGKELGRSTAAAGAERVRVVGEMGRVLKPGGVGVVWDVQHVPEYVKKLDEMGMEEITVSEPVTAFMMTSHIVSFRKPPHLIVAPTSLHWTSYFLS